jgi:heme A synthase
MKPATILFHITAAWIFLQLVLGALLVFGYIDTTVHIIDGIIVLGLAVATMVVTILSKPRYRPSMLLSSILVVLIVVQGILGFIAFNNNAVVVVHFTNAMIIYALAVMGVFYSRQWSKMSQNTVQAPEVSGPTKS